MRSDDLRKRARWLNEVALNVTSHDVAALLNSYAQDMIVEAAEIEGVIAAPGRPRLVNLQA